MKKLSLFLVLIFLVFSSLGYASSPFPLAPGEASETEKGTSERATTVEAAAGTDTERYVTPAGLAAGIAAISGIGANETYGSGWNADTGVPEKDDIYDYLHLLDTNDDGDIDVIDATLWALKISLSEKAAASGVASLDASSLVVQNPTNATATPTASKIPIADGSGKLDGWISAATETVVGKAELATDAETVTGTATDKVTTPANIAALNADSTTDLIKRNITAKATPGTELITWTDAGWNEDGATWTFAASTLTHVTGNVTAVTGTVTGALAVGTTYRVIITGTGGTATATYTLGGCTGTTIAASGAIAIEDYLTATADSELVITPANTCTVALTLVSVKALTDATGDATIQGNLNVYSPATFSSSLTLSRGQVLLSNGTLAAPSLAFASDPNSGMYLLWDAYPAIVQDGTEVARFHTGIITLPSTVAGIVFYDSTLVRDADNILAQRNSTNAQAYRLYATYVSDTSYERLGINTAAGSITLAAETLDAGTDNIDIILTPAGTGQVKNTAANITVGSGTGITVNSTGNLNRQVYQVTTTYDAYTDIDTTKGIVIATLPAKTKLVGVYADTTTKYLGGAVNAATLEVGITAEGAAEILAAHNVFTAAILSGLADAEMGTSMTRAAAIQGGYLPSWTGTTAIYATIDTTAGNLNALTQGVTVFYLVTERF